MKRRAFLAVVCTVATMAVCGQTALPQVYDENINPLEQIKDAMKEANTHDKFIVCQVGGNWCPWCLRLADFVKNDSTISKLIADNFVYIHLNYNPRRSAFDAAKRTWEEAMMQRLGNPVRFGFPVLVVLDKNGKVLHTQDSSFLEEGQAYSHDKVLRFLQCWTPSAVGN